MRNGLKVKGGTKSPLWLPPVHVHQRSSLPVPTAVPSSGRQAEDAFVADGQAVAVLHWRARSLLRRRLRQRLDRGAAWATQTGIRRGWKAWRDWVSERPPAGRWWNTRLLSSPRRISGLHICTTRVCLGDRADPAALSSEWPKLNTAFHSLPRGKSEDRTGWILWTTIALYCL